MKKKSIIVRSTANLFLPLACIYGAYVVFHGHISAGGGFQGGVLMVGIVTLIYFGHGFDTTCKAIHPNFLHGAEGFMSILYVAAAMLGVAYLGNFCQNVFSNIGNIGDLFSSGTIFIMDSIVGLKVLTGVGVLAITMLGLVMAQSSDEKE